MNTLQTQCPHCHHVFGITAAQLTLRDGLARCGYCKQIFSAKENLLQTATQSNSQSTATTPPAAATVPVIDARDTVKITPAKTPQKTIADDLLFDDNSGIEHDEPQPTVSTTPHDFNLDILENFDENPAINPALSNATHSPNPEKANTAKDDESWLEELLEQDAKNERERSYLASSKSPTPSNVTDVSSLLEELGVEVAPEKPLKQSEYQQRLNERFSQPPTAQQRAEKAPLSSIILWGFGCGLLLLSLIAQYVIFNRFELIKNPETAVQLHAICDGLHLPCDLPYADSKAVDIKMLSFEANSSNSDLIFSLTNRSSQSQIYPNLKITLQSNRATVAQFVVTPQQYLDDTGRILLPQQIKPVKLRINFPRSQADQVAIDPFY